MSEATKWCSTCCAQRPVANFNQRRAARDGLDRQCRDCINTKRRELRERNPAILEQERRWREENREKIRAYAKSDRERNGDRRRELERLRNSSPERRKVKAERRRDLLYGFKPGEYDSMLRRQCGLCFICQRQPTAPRPLAVDHCHSTGIVRKLLCDPCNQGLGLFKDDALLLVRASTYLEMSHG